MFRSLSGMFICMSFPKKAENEEVGDFWFCE